MELVLKSHDSSKASGPDGINPRILKEGAIELSYPLCNLFNKSLSQGISPNNWKCANVAPIFKKGDKSDPQNYSPISLLSVVGKVMERLVHKKNYNFLIDKQFITNAQSGFTGGDSTINQLLLLYDTFCNALDEGKEVRAIFLRYKQSLRQGVA